jgi:hypothetical protein
MLRGLTGRKPMLRGLGQVFFEGAIGFGAGVWARTGRILSQDNEGGNECCNQQDGQANGDDGLRQVAAGSHHDGPAMGAYRRNWPPQ